MKKTNTSENEWWVYILECADRSLYTGIATNIERRLKEHNSDNKKGAKYTSGRRPLVLRYKQKAGSRSKALKEEARIKKLPRLKKLELIQKHQ